MMNNLLYYKLHLDVKDPIHATTGSACFDLHSFLQKDSVVKVYMNQFEELDIKERIVQNGRVQVNPTERVLIPTGLIFDIPEGLSLRLYPRSSLALKQGITLANNVGIIDSDYVEPVYMMVCNITNYSKYVNDGERICQAELVKVQTFNMQETVEQPEQKTMRDGGFGSTGK